MSPSAPGDDMRFLHMLLSGGLDPSIIAGIRNQQQRPANPAAANTSPTPGVSASTYYSPQNNYGQGPMGGINVGQLMGMAGTAGR